MYWHRIHKTSLRVKNTIPESIPCTMCAWYCGWGDHNLPQETSCYISILYFHYIFSFHRKTHLRCISSVLLHYNRKINANILDVCQGQIYSFIAQECLGRIYKYNVHIWTRCMPRPNLLYQNIFYTVLYSTVHKSQFVTRQCASYI